MQLYVIIYTYIYIANTRFNASTNHIVDATVGWLLLAIVGIGQKDVYSSVHCFELLFEITIRIISADISTRHTSDTIYSIISSMRCVLTVHYFLGDRFALTVTTIFSATGSRVVNGFTWPAYLCCIIFFFLVEIEPKQDTVVYYTNCCYSSQLLSTNNTC